MSFQLPPDIEQLFVTDYDQVQDALQSQLRQHPLPDLQHQQLLYPAPSPGRHPLASDLIWFGPKNAARLLVLISGTHGVEGYCGSAIQRFLLTQLQHGQLQLPVDTAVLVFHGLNAWGMAWARRCDEQGIDLNRNFLDFNLPLPTTHPRYPEMLSCLREQDPGNRKIALALMKQQLGETEYERCLSGGQYSEPRAPFYGGTRAAVGHEHIAQIVENLSLGRRELVVVDLHTGLGPWAYGEIISDHPPGSIGEAYAEHVFGKAAVAVPAKGTSFSVPKLGLQDYYWHQFMEQQGCFITLEFGTHPTEQLFDVVIADHLYWAEYTPDSLQDKYYLQQRQAMLNHFCPNDKVWQQAALFKSWQVCRQVFDYWTGTPAARELS